MFDGAIMGWLFNINPKLWLDTLSMARPLHAMQRSLSLKSLCEHYNLGAKGDEVINALGKQRKDFTAQELARYGKYCVNDVDLTHKLFKKLAKGFPAAELQVIDASLRMYIEPRLELDAKLLQDHLVSVVNRKLELMEKLEARGISKGELMSNPQLAQLLISLGVEPPKKISKTTGEETYAFAKNDKEFAALAEHPNELVQAIVAARLGVKSTLEETRTKALLNVHSRGKLPVALNYYGAHTGRFSGGEKLNLQNLPRKGALRSAMKAPKDHVIIACDSSQIEARTLAWVANQSDLLESFREKRDVYSEFASELYGRTITKADKVERFVGKVCVLGLGYSLGPARLQETLTSGAMGMKVSVSEEQCQRLVSVYRSKYWRIPGQWQVGNHMLDDMIAGRSGKYGYSLTYDETGLLLPNGLKINYPVLQRDKNKYRYIADQRSYTKLVAARLGGMPLDDDDLPWVYIYGGKVAENVTQALARIVISEQMIELRKKYPVVLQVHDELVFTAPIEEAEEAVAYAVKVMSTPPKWAPELPVACEAGVGPTYGDAK
jgi:DNA polymerase